jgi:hypothetical protein
VSRVRHLAPRLALALIVGALALWLLWPLARSWRERREADVVELHHRSLPTRQPDTATNADSESTRGARTTIYPTVPEVDVRALFALDTGTVYDPISLVRRPSNWENRVLWPEHPLGEWWVRTNSLGLREDRELAATRPALRILVAGDSHTDGACNNDESFPHVLESLLCVRSLERAPAETPSVEVINAGMGGTSFHCYLGALERFLDLQPHAFVFAVYGGNDFNESLALHAYFHRSADPPSTLPFWDRVDSTPRSGRAGLVQSVVSLKYFAEYPEQTAVALEAAREVTGHIRDLCAERGIRLLCVYIPPVTDVAPERLAPVFEDLCERLSLSPRDLASTDCMADEYLAWLARERIEYLDLRPIFRAERESMYWRKDWHVSVAGHLRIAQALLERF